ncbi:MAG: peptide ABC transporter ATP-binding protein, partial [Chloroflexota bacterium]|nr:peptide ABC transporter ATP-binding protein [Chloroflexota bacterium]
MSTITKPNAGVDSRSNATRTTMSESGDDTLLRVEGLKMHFPITSGILIQRVTGAVRAVDGLDFTIKKGETLG